MLMQQGSVVKRGHGDGRQLSTALVQGRQVVVRASRRRQPIETMSDILRAASGGGATMTLLACRTNTNFLRARAYVDLLVRRNLIEVLDGVPKLYKATVRGDELARTLLDADKLLLGRIGSAPSVVQQGSSNSSSPDWNDFELRELRGAFAMLSRACRLRDRCWCSLGRCDCRPKDCPLFDIEGSTRQASRLCGPLRETG